MYILLLFVKLLDLKKVFDKKVFFPQLVTFPSKLVYCKILQVLIVHLRKKILLLSYMKY